LYIDVLKKDLVKWKIKLKKNRMFLLNYKIIERY